MKDERREAMRERKHTKRLALVGLLAGVLMLSGCMNQLEERPAEDVSGAAVVLDAQAPLVDAVQPRTEWITLYFLDEEGMELVPVVRSMEIEDGMRRSEAALRALIAGPTETEDAFWPDIGQLNPARGFELSGGVATVDLPARVRALSPEALYAVRMAITHTLTEFAEVSYVNVLVGGREEGFDLAATTPVGTLSRSEELDVASRYLRQDEMRLGAQETGLTRLTTLYFPTKDGRWMLPEVRSVAYAAPEPIEYLYTLLEEIGKGTDNALCMDAPAPMKYIEEMPEIVRTEDGAYRAIEICLSEEIDEALLDAGLSRGVYLAMLTDTLMGFVPGVEGVLVRIGGEQITALSEQETPDGQARAFAQTLATRADFGGYVGAPGVIYIPAREQGKLETEISVMDQARQHSARSQLWQLTRRLCEIGALDDGLAQEDILAVSVDEARIVIHLSAAYADALAALTQAQERAAVYAMVNTLTEGDGPERVAFFFEGEQRASLAGGLEMRGEFLRNPGMVVEQ